MVWFLILVWPRTLVGHYPAVQQQHVPRFPVWPRPSWSSSFMRVSNKHSISRHLYDISHLVYFILLFPLLSILLGSFWSYLVGFQYSISPFLDILWIGTKSSRWLKGEHQVNGKTWGLPNSGDVMCRIVLCAVVCMYYFVKVITPPWLVLLWQSPEHWE